MLVLISFQFSLYLMTSQGDHITIAALRWLYDIDDSNVRLALCAVSHTGIGAEAFYPWSP